MKRLVDIIVRGYNGSSVGRLEFWWLCTVRRYSKTSRPNK